ncbi:type II toxin-antitoxin system HicB family antitoxin [Aquabacter sp. CN5-332]|uniref:type II toxin-antitoxin system HicB family antitoxin n=1 Tax=Aquabacter sp. CN5-332 TaxID=3156608 RepID=UPI0032B4257C
MPYAIGIVHVENGAFGISFPDFPGCISSGNTLDEAVTNGAQALAFHLEGLVADGIRIPELSTLESHKAWEADWLEGGVAVTVPVDIPKDKSRMTEAKAITELKALVKHAAVTAKRSRYH